jgi:hypothetical protein
MSRHFLKAAALSFATSVALPLAAPAHAEPTPVRLDLAGTELNLAYIDTTNPSNIILVQKGEDNYVESYQRGSINGLAVLQLGYTQEVDAVMDGDKNTVNIQQVQHKGRPRAKQKLLRAVVGGNYYLSYTSNGFGFGQVTSYAPRVGNLGR